jgi:prefoldin alpha subunit
MAAAPPQKPQPKSEQQVTKIGAMEELRYIQQLYQTQYMMVGQEVESRAAALRELEGARLTLENYDKVKGKKNVLPVGAGIFVNGAIGESSTVLMEIGAGYMLERTIDEAKAAVAKKLDKETEAIKHLQKSRRELEAALVEVSYRIESLSYG